MSRETLDSRRVFSRAAIIDNLASCSSVMFDRATMRSYNSATRPFDTKGEDTGKEPTSASRKEASSVGNNWFCKPTVAGVRIGDG